MEEGGVHSEKLSKNANVFQDNHYTGNFEKSVFSLSPQAGKNLSRQYQSGSQSILSEVAFFLPTDIFRIKGCLWKVGMEKEQFCCLGMSRVL